MRVVRTVAFGVCALLATVSSVNAQALGQVAGIVTNSHGAGLAGVSVSLDNAGLSQPLVVVTTASGAFELPRVPAGTYILTCRLAGFQDVVLRRVDVSPQRTVTFNVTLETAGGVKSLPFDAGRATTGATFDSTVLLGLPTARDTWQILTLAPGVTLSGVNVAGSTSDQQLTPSAFGSSTDVQWHVNGGTTTDMSSNSSPAYYNFDSLEGVQVITGGSDVSVATQGLFINLITKSGANALGGSATTTLATNGLQSQNVSQEAFANGSPTGLGLTGNPLRHIGVTSGEIGGPIRKDRVWFWAGADNQDLDVTTANFIDRTRAGCDAPPFTFSDPAAIQACLADDKTTIRNVDGTVTARVGETNTVAVLYQTNQKLRNNRAGTQVPTDVSSTASQYSGGSSWTASPTVQASHTWRPLNALVMDNQVTYAMSAFFLDSHDYTRCGSSTYARDQAGQDPDDPTCSWNVQAVTNRTTGITTRAPADGSYQTSRPSWEIKTDDHYFAPRVLGGDHTFRFGAGWRKDPVLSYSHHGGGAVATVECVGNVLLPTCAAIVPRQAVLWRDGLVNYDWRAFNGYVQDSYATHRLTVTGGTRWDWQTSAYLGGCVSANVLVPTLLPRQCQTRNDPDVGLSALAPRFSATDDLFGDGRTTVHGSAAWYRASKLVLANRFSNTGSVSLTFGPNFNSGACTGLSCWTDLNHDSTIQANELSGSPTASSPAFINGVLSNTFPFVADDVTPARTREGIVGVDRELGRGFQASVNFVYRYTDLGSANYTLPFGASAGDSLVQPVIQATSLWERHVWGDPSTGILAPYYTLCSGCSVYGGNSIITRNLTHSTYAGVTLAVSKRLANHWQAEASYTWNDARVFTPVGTFSTTGNIGNPTGIEFTNSFTNGTPPHDLKAFGYIELPRHFMAGWNLSVRSGDLRTLTIDGPGTVANGTGTITYRTLTFQDAGATRTPVTSLLDLNVARTFALRRASLTLTVDCFNVLNSATALSYVRDDLSNNAEGLTTSYGVSTIVPPRVFRLGARFSF